MSHYKGRLAEILLETYQNASALLYYDGPPPRPGQYLHVLSDKQQEQAVPVSVFLAGIAIEAGVQISGELPQGWEPGEQLEVRGPLGKGFELPKRAKRVLLAPQGKQQGRLLPVIPLALAQGAEVVLCSGAAPTALPLSVEVRGLADLPDLIAWADYLAIDVAIEDMDELGLGVGGKLPKALVAEALVVAPMPCGGLAKCGVCAIVTRSGERLVCEDGPVFELGELLSVA